ncbi:MAG: endopeptidase La [Candidatus Omnitrophota bacterium]
MARFRKKDEVLDLVKNQSKVEEIRLHEIMPTIPLRDIIVFPGMVVPLLVGRPKTVNAIEEARVTDNLAVLVFQKNSETEEPSKADLFSVGVVAKILQVVHQNNGQVKVLVEALFRVRINTVYVESRYFATGVEVLAVFRQPGPEEEASVRLLGETVEIYLRLNPIIPRELQGNLFSFNDPEKLTDMVSGYLPLKKEDKAKVLEIDDLPNRFRLLLQILKKEIEVLEIQHKIQGEVFKKIEKNQRDYILQEQIKTIQQELGKETESSEVKSIQEKIEAAGMPETVKKKAMEELDRFSKMMSLSPEATVIRNYLDWMVNLPWQKVTEDNLDIRRAGTILEEDHYGLEKPKERILEYLAVRKRNPNLKGPILCFVGPPGSGKTSLGKSIARALDRQFTRISLGGVRDEAEIRGHRRTYIGSLPGRIIQSLRKVSVRNPVFLLDEVDKIGIDFRGDPSYALLEVLDPEQNNTFNDHYLEVDFDLSQVLFITTANNEATIPPPLLDRMEIISLPGYTLTEKIEIAKKFLIPREITDNGLKPEELLFTEESLAEVIRAYTREAGVRNLQRRIATICRKVVKEKELNGPGNGSLIRVTKRLASKYLGVPQYLDEKSDLVPKIGVVTGLAWTEYGGDVIFTEVGVLKGKGNLIITGRLGDVMKESCRIALSLVRMHSEDLKIDPDSFRKQDLHIHIPSGAVPKDGPSAGITIATALASRLAQKPVPGDLAMTGEITLRGKVMPIGGLRAKLLAASRAGIKRVIIPKDNQKDLAEIPKRELTGLEIIPVDSIEEVLDRAFATTTAV